MSDSDAREPATTATGWVPEFPSTSTDDRADGVVDPLVARPSVVLDASASDDRFQASASDDLPQLDQSGKPIQKDWAWVEEWRAGGEPTPWGPGIVLAAFAAAIVSIAIYVITAGLIDRPFLAIVANVVIAGGLSPALYMARTLPVLRWVSLGGAVGAALAWIAVIFFPVVAAA